MIITDYHIHSKQELFNIIRNTHLAGNKNLFPFHNSKISIQTMSWRDTVPTQTFVLNDQLSNIHKIHTQMLDKNIDIFKMDGFLSYQTDMLDSTFVFTPPIIEVIDDQPLVIDGQHRITYTADNNMTFNALVIENIDRSVYPYQLPIDGGWNAVKRFETALPTGFVRKQRRYSTSEQNKFFFREYPFPGIIKLMRQHSGTRESR